MAFSVKDWRDTPDATTPLSAAALEDLETRVTDYTDTTVATKQPLDGDLTAIAALTSAADKLPYATGAQAWALTTLSAFARTYLDDTDAATTRATLGAQAQDTDLDAIAALTSAADKWPYATGAGTWALADVSPFARTYLDDTTAAATRTTLSVYSQSEATFAFEPHSDELTAITGVTPAADKLPYFTSATAATVTTLTSYMRTLLDDTTAAAARATLESEGSAVYAKLAETRGQIGSAAIAGTYSFTVGGAVSGSSGATAVLQGRVYLKAADFAVTGRTTKLRVRLQLNTNATAPAITFTAGLALWSSSAGAANLMSMAYSTTHTGSTAATASPSASTVGTPVDSADFDVPTDGLYILTLKTSGTIATDARVDAVVELFVHHT